MSAKFSLLAIALAALTFVPTAPASAQTAFFNTGYGNNINVRQRVMLDRIQNLRSRGLLTPGEYSRLMNRFNFISSRESMARVGGLNFRERAMLETQLSQLDREIQVLGHNGNRQFASRWYRRGWF